MDPGRQPESELDFQNAAELTQQRRIYKRKPKTAKYLINNIIARRGIAAEKSNQKLQNTWDSIVGMDLANQTKVASVKRGVLEVIVANSSVMQFLSFSKHEYKEQINQQMPNEEILDLRFSIGRIS